MNLDKCRKCKHYTCYYHGFEASKMFSHHCWWTLKDSEDVGEDKCHYEAKENENEQHNTSFEA